jgi:AraC-like DNA-binding protein
MQPGTPLAMAPAQTYVERLPDPALGDLVRTVWVQRIGPEPYVQRNLPTGGVELHCRVGSPPRVVGPLTGPSVESLAPGTTVVGVRFRPGVARIVLECPARQLVDLTVDLDELWGPAALALGEQVAQAPSPEAALGILQDELAGRRAEASPPDPLVAEAVQRLLPWRSERIGALGAGLGISESKLRRRCLAAVGIGPKPLQRILRFQGFVARAQARNTRPTAPAGGGLAELAAVAGYADHAHLSRECMRLAGVSPRTYVGEGTPCECGHDHAASFLPFLRPPVSPSRA